MQNVENAGHDAVWNMQDVSFLIAVLFQQMPIHLYL